MTPSCCVRRVNLAKASVALRQLITLDAVALAAFRECASPPGQERALNPNLTFAPGLNRCWSYSFRCSFSVYFSALILTLSQQMTSDRINLYPTSNATLW